MKLPKIFKPQKNYSLSRFGRNYDGGYLVSNKSILDAKSLISFGVLDDTSFEVDFLKLNKVPIFCFDHTLTRNYWKKRIFNDIGASIFNLNLKFLINTFERYLESRKFFKLNNVKLFNQTITYNSIRKILKYEILKPIFFKIDIEGSEYRILDELIESQDLIVGLVIEFHNVDLQLEKIIDFINKFNLQLTHIHPNNYGEVDKFNNPTVIEFTFEKNPIEGTSDLFLPNRLDQPNNPDKHDLELFFN